MKKIEAVAPSAQPIPMSLVLMAALLINLPLLVMRLPLSSYDTNFHIFFASHYLHHWFDPWNPKWYAGFSQTTYPPLPQQWIAVISHITGVSGVGALVAGYMVVQLAAILILVVGVYRFARLWVSPRAASFAALATVFAGALNFLVYSAGQLGTTWEAAIYINALPYMFDWIRHGKGRSFLKAVVLFAAAAASHTTILLFGSFFFVIPLLALAKMDRQEGDPISWPTFVRRVITMFIVVVAAVVVVILPYWIALIRYPVTQTPIPHPSRANYILNLYWGLNYFIVPYGMMILALPFIVLRGSKVARLRPLLLGFWVAFLIGLGGTTPVGEVLLGRAFQVLTMERFSFWANLLALPFIGLLATELIARFRLRATVGLAIAAAVTCALGVSWVTYRAHDNPKVHSVALWLNRGGHDQYRYVTLGFGSSIARLATLTNANSVDGEWNSGRHLPELTRHGGAALTAAKYFGQPGLDALRAILRHADKYGLKWVFVADPYYDPLLKFAGWRHVDELQDGTIAVWSKDGVPPATPINAPEKPPRWEGLMWGILPFASSILAILVLIFVRDGRRLEPEAGDTTTCEDLVPGGAAS